MIISYVVQIFEPPKLFSKRKSISSSGGTYDREDGDGTGPTRNRLFTGERNVQEMRAHLLFTELGTFGWGTVIHQDLLYHPEASTMGHGT
jgi:hypothetical protein